MRAWERARVALGWAPRVLVLDGAAVSLVDRVRTWVTRTRATAPASAPLAVVPSLYPFGGNLIPPLSHTGYCHEPFSGAWQANRECFGPGGIFSAVYACIAIISGDVAKLQPRIRKRLPDGSKQDFDNHPAARVLFYPNSYQTRVDFWGQFMASCLFTGNTYVYLERDQRGVISGMHILDPRRVSVLIASDGSAFYRIGDQVLIDALGTDIMPARVIMHHRLLSLHHPLVGVTPLFAAGVSAATGQQIQANSQAFFANMSRPSGALMVPGKLDDATLARLKSEWDLNFRNGQMGRTAVLQGGMKWETLQINAVDAQLIEQLRWSVEDVARCFRVPSYMLADASKLSFKNAEQLARNYYSQTLQYHIESMEARIDKDFELAGDVYCEFDLEALLRMEFDARMTAYSTAINSGVLTINEVRRKEELPPMEGGSEPLVQMQYRPLSMAGEQPPSTSSPPPPSDPPSGDDPADPESEPDDGDLEEAALTQLVRARVRERLAA